MTNTSPSDRDKKILAYLEENGSASIQELADALSVSTMTIHRDLNRLSEAGQVHKMHGSAKLADNESDNDYSCAMCGKSILGKKVFIIHLANGEQKNTCCAHCGLMLLAVTKDAWQSMTMDFLHGHMVSANQAFYVLGSDLKTCCVPSIFSFGSKEEAEKFQKGFGGRLLNMDEAIQSMSHTGHKT